MPAIMNKLRENTHVILIILVLAFIGTIIFDWGMNYMGDQSQGMPHKGNIGKINGKTISYDQFFRQLQQEYVRIRERTGEEPAESQMEMMRESLWNRIVNEILINEQVKKRNIRITDDEILTILKTDPPQFLRENPSFMTDDVFDLKKYEEALHDPNIDWSMVENAVRQSQPTVKMQNQIFSMIRFTEDEVLNEFYRQKTRAKAAYIFQGANFFQDVETNISDSDIQSYYDSHNDDFKKPEQRQIKYVLFPTATTAQDSQSIREEAQDVFERANEGEDFAELARIYSEDNSAEDGGDLGYFTPGDMIKEFEEAAMEAEIDEVVGPVQTRFGLHIIKVLDKKYKKKKSRRSKAVIDSIRAQHILFKFEASTSTIDDARYRASYFSQIAEEEGFEKALREDPQEVKETEFFTRGGFIPGIGMNEELTRFAFSRAVDEVSGAMEDSRGYYVAKVHAVQEERISPLDEVGSQIEGILRNERLKSLAFEKINNIYEQIQSGTSFEEATKAADVSIDTTNEFGPTEYVDGIGREPNFSAKVLGMKVGDVAGPIETDKGYYLMKLLEKNEPSEAEFEREKNYIIQRLIGEKQQFFLISWIDYLRKNSDIEDYRDEYFNR